MNICIKIAKIKTLIIFKVNKFYQSLAKEKPNSFYKFKFLLIKLKKPQLLKKLHFIGFAHIQSIAKTTLASKEDILNLKNYIIILKQKVYC